MSFQTIASAAVLGITCGVTPGPLFALMLGETLAKGRRAGLAVAVAPLITDLPIILVSVFAIAAASRSASVIAAISVAGGLFVGYLAISTFRSTLRPPDEAQPSRSAESAETGKKTELLDASRNTDRAQIAQNRGKSRGNGGQSSLRAGLLKAIVANFLNPGPYLYWLTVGAPLILGAWRESPASALAYLAVFYASLSLSMAALVCVAGRGRDLLRGKAHAWVMRALATMLLYFSGYFLGSGVARFLA